MEIDPSALSPADRYKLLIGCIVPRPIAVVSTVSRDKRFNLAPYSFFNGIGSNPMSLLFCPSNKGDGSEKDSLRNAKPRDEGGTGDFVVNVATEEQIRKIVAASEPLEYGESEFELVGLTPVASTIVKAPRVAESPAAFECVTRGVLRMNEGVAGGGNVVIGEVVCIHVEADLVNERLHVDPAQLKAVGRMGGLGYAFTRDRFELPRGRAALDADLPEPLG
jgi:flavin reductase (DIM6/NTAB) family NADH-FMN oxidoreductase RutF